MILSQNCCFSFPKIQDPNCYAEVILPTCSVPLSSPTAPALMIFVAKVLGLSFYNLLLENEISPKKPKNNSFCYPKSLMSALHGSRA